VAQFRRARDVLDLVPLSAKLVRRSWTLLLRHHIYQADAIQVATGLDRRADGLLTSDGPLLRAAAAEGLRVFDPESDGAKIAEARRSPSSP